MSAPVDLGGRTRFDWRALLERYGALVALLVLVAITATLRDNFLKPENIFNVLRANSYVGILAIGMTFVIISAGIDLSVGSMMAFIGVLGVMALNAVIGADGIVAAADAADEARGLIEQARQTQQAIDLSWQRALDVEPNVVAEQFARLMSTIGLAGSELGGVIVAVVLMLAAGFAAGLFNGVLIAKGRIAPFIVTLGAMAAYRSLALTMAGGGEVRSASTGLFGAIGQGGIPLPFVEVAPGRPLTLHWAILIFFGVAVAGWVLLAFTRYGRYVYAVGCNETSARYSAINVDRVKMGTYALIGICAAVAALLLASRQNSVGSSTIGQFAELDAIAAVVIGGTRMEGGRGSVWGTVVGVLIMGLIGNMLIWFDAPPLSQGMIKGAIIIAAVLMQRTRAVE